jgi:hypothetical protein
MANTELRRGMQPIEFIIKFTACDFFDPLPQGVRFCTGNDPKRLALCAARSHIGAVR